METKGMVGVIQLEAGFVAGLLRGDCDLIEDGQSRLGHPIYFNSEKTTQPWGVHMEVLLPELGSIPNEAVFADVKNIDVYGPETEFYKEYQTIRAGIANMEKNIRFTRKLNGVETKNG